MNEAVESTQEPELQPSTGYMLTPEDLVAVHARVIEVARTILDEDGAAAVSLFVRGMSQQDAARALGWSETKMSRVLHGATAGAKSGRKNALETLYAALRDDAMFVAIYKAIRATFEERATERTREPPPDAVITDWYLSTLRPAKPGMVVPLAVLMVADRLADRKRELRYEDLCRYLPTMIVGSSLSPLKMLGYIQTDGVKIRILKTPADALKAVPSSQTTSPAFVSAIFDNMKEKAA